MTVIKWLGLIAVALCYSWQVDAGPADSHLAVESRLVSEGVVDILVIGIADRPALLSQRLLFGAYVELQAVAENGKKARFLGAIASVIPATTSDLRPLKKDEIFGVRLKVREYLDLAPGVTYSVTVVYHCLDGRWTYTAEETRRLRERWGDLPIVAGDVKARPINIRVVE